MLTLIVVIVHPVFLLNVCIVFLGFGVGGNLLLLLWLDLHLRCCCCVIVNVILLLLLFFLVLDLGLNVGDDCRKLFGTQFDLEWKGMVSCCYDWSYPLFSPLWAQPLRPLS